jgi:shikimate kinase
MKIYLVGMPGSGKTTLGKLLAEKLHLEFIDLDKEIEFREGLSIPEIFSTKGEDYFRLSESTTLNDFAARPGDFIISTGGGAPCFYNGMKTMNTTGLTIFLDVEIIELARRMARTDRPLLKSEVEDELIQRITALAEKRMACYREAQIIIKDPSLEKVLEKLSPKK